jgi:hypothetical protein
LSLAFCLPSTRTDKNGAMGGHTAKELLTLNNKGFVTWNQANVMITKEEIVNYINTQRESQKNLVINIYESLTAEDRKIVVDLKRYGLNIVQDKVDKDGNIKGMGGGEDGAAGAGDGAGDDAYEAEGRREFNVRYEEPDAGVNDDRID